jgi:hypothetical protein
MIYRKGWWYNTSWITISLLPSPRIRLGLALTDSACIELERTIRDDGSFILGKSSEFRDIFGEL